jgi:hypothetical protein
MSGSSGPSIGGDGGNQDPCSALRLERNLEAPVPGVADVLKVGDILSVQLRDGDPPAVALVTDTGALAGSVVPTVRLLDCLRQGVPYKAEVQEAAAGIVHVEVKASS